MLLRFGKLRARCLAAVARVGRTFDEFDFCGRAVATPGVSALLRRHSRVRRAVSHALRTLQQTGEGLVIRVLDNGEQREIEVRPYRGGAVAVLLRGANYCGDCWREIGSVNGWPSRPAFAIRRGTGELIDRRGRLSLLPAS